ncbi:RNA polymerase sigma24 factor [Actinocatenispora thailandica]|uniref:RNA polymerase sigma24 factor n=1 Tax=Actinocatenispora thailandica TaxID=227318 RepID=A0A7R7I0J8_9ACTN|nr:RNA polymerase sigma factor SigJ [Actinocatenispora thailandica]BCJ38108.1 RNA polymerase sigma24 factor [Actinocatenispora thailandica]
MDTEPVSGRYDPGPAAVLGERRALTSLAYRLLGSLADAEDVVQEAYLRWYRLSGREREQIASPGGWLTTVASRICLDLLGSARARRERYVGEWIPEPVPGDGTPPGGPLPNPPPDPADRVTLDESVTMAFLVVLDSMTPAERVALILHDVYGYRFTDVAVIVGRTAAACRQLATSARRRIRAAQPAAKPDDALRQRVVRDFRRAWEAQDIDALLGLLDPDATVVVDGGGLVSAARQPIHGGRQIVRYLMGFVGRGQPPALQERTVNGQPGLVARRGDDLVVVAAVEVVGDRIARIWAVRNPEKLRTGWA